MREVRLRNAPIPEGGLAFPGARVAEERALRFPDGSLSFLLNAPAVRSWGPHDDLRDAEPVAWSLCDESGGARLATGAGGADADLLELGPDAAAAFLAERPEPLTVVPSFRPLGSARELGDYLVAGRVLTGTERRKKPVDAISLSLYRIARLRGGPVWTAVADHVAAVAAGRLESAEPDLVHDTWTGGETHVRYLNDAILLMVAHAELTGADRWRRAAERGCALLDEHFTVDLGGGRWVLHDSLERDAGRNDVVLNTHLQAIIALHAAGRDVDAHVRAAAHALGPRVRGRAGLRAAAGIALVEAGRARAPRRYVRHRVGNAYTRAGEVCSRERALRLPGGWIARDLSGERVPGRYLTVNLGDLAGVVRALDAAPPEFRHRLEQGLRFAGASGFFRAEIRDATALAGLIPSTLRLAGRERAAARAAERARAAGLHPMAGWPGHVDRLWARLGDATPL